MHNCTLSTQKPTDNVRISPGGILKQRKISKWCLAISVQYGVNTAQAYLNIKLVNIKIAFYLLLFINNIITFSLTWNFVPLPQPTVNSVENYSYI